jgi:glucosamine--fructose-6-phosphate aminotransferase (isomerizing)
MFLASMAAAFIGETRSMQLIEDGEVVSITPEGSRFVSVEHGELEREVVEVDWDLEAAEKSGYETFMLKEIYEQPTPSRDARRPDPARRARAREPRHDRDRAAEPARIVSSPRARRTTPASSGRYMIEEWARLPVEPDIASEWIYRNPVLSKDTLVIGISQSGESRDTVNAIKLARDLGAARSRSRT